MSLFNLHAIPNQKGHLAVVTGSNTGIGYFTALELAKKDYEVVLACRNMDKAMKASKSIQQVYPAAKLMCLELDLSDLESVREFVKIFHAHYQQLDLLINNAGIMRTAYKLTKDGFENQLASNYLGHFLLTGLLLPTLEKTSGSRVISLSSLAHRMGKIRLHDPHFKEGYDAMTSYRQSKLACLMFAYELDRRLKDKGLQMISVAAHPGIAITELIDHFKPFIKVIANAISPVLFQSPHKGALPVLRAALDREVKGGSYYGPGGFLEFKGPPVLVRSTSRSHDTKLAAQLWNMSEKMTGISYDFNVG